MGTRQREDTYSKERVEGLLDQPLKSNADMAVDAIELAENIDVLKFLIEDHKIDVVHNQENGLGEVRRAVLESDKAPNSLKQKVATRGDDTTKLESLVPEAVKKSALGALEAGKPVVLYGPTGTGKTTFAKQLALETSVGYTLETASPSWTKQDIIGRVEPNYNEDTISYRKEPGCVSEAVLRARDFDAPYSVIIDELTRADISKIFGPLYTAIENKHQTIFTTDDGRTIELDPEVNIICTMNMSDRTVNELDNAITRRFAMIEVSEYKEDDRRELFSTWTAQYLYDSTAVKSGELQELFEEDYTRLNGVNTDDAKDGIQQFGPMHYEDVAKFIGQTTKAGGVYEEDPQLAVGESFRTYIVPRLLNSATYSQVNKLAEHYEKLDDEFDFDLSRATELVQSELASEEQRMGT
ncbi:AAA domain-containing protein [Haloferax volcanii]|uniref:AAA domain-containing protein n=1 Tax=Haloferax volcanii TaxID=2246 RepID=A0A6C0UUD9_HALVO|nr:AAA family ATPase [Haloferax alexandrinus]QIB79102.1 AAA domain-containing protein [Haloferax alexandrinus]